MLEIYDAPEFLRYLTTLSAYNSKPFAHGINQHTYTEFSSFTRHDSGSKHQHSHAQESPAAETGKVGATQRIASASRSPTWLAAGTAAAVDPFQDERLPVQVCLKLLDSPHNRKTLFLDYGYLVSASDSFLLAIRHWLQNLVILQQNSCCAYVRGICSKHKVLLQVGKSQHRLLEQFHLQSLESSLTNIRPPHDIRFVLFGRIRERYGDGREAGHKLTTIADQPPKNPYLLLRPRTRSISNLTNLFLRFHATFSHLVIQVRQFGEPQRSTWTALQTT